MYSKAIQFYVYIYTYIQFYVYTYTYICIYMKSIYMYTYILFQILFPCSLLQNTEQSSLSYTVGPYWLSALYIVVYTHNPNLLIYSPPFSFSNHRFVFEVYKSVSML